MRYHIESGSYLIKRLFVKKNFESFYRKSSNGGDSVGKFIKSDFKVMLEVKRGRGGGMGRGLKGFEVKDLNCPTQAFHTNCHNDTIHILGIARHDSS